MTIGEAVRFLRERAGESQQEMADAVGVCRNTIVGIETGKRHPSVKAMCDIRRHYGYDPYLLAALSGWKVNVSAHLALLGKEGD